MVTNQMKLKEILLHIQGKVVSDGYNPEAEIKGGCGADLMSDVLASTQPDSILLTGYATHRSCALPKFLMSGRLFLCAEKHHPQKPST